MDGVASSARAAAQELISFPTMIGSYLQLIRRRWVLLAAIWGAVVLAAFVGTQLQTPVYQAESQVLFRTIDSDALFPRLGEASNLVLRDAGGEGAFVASDRFENLVRDALDFDAEFDLTASLVQPPGGDRDAVEPINIRFRVRAEEGRTASLIANLAASVYVEERHADDVRDFENRTDFLTERVNERFGDLLVVSKPLNDIDNRIAASSDIEEQQRLLEQRRLLGISVEPERNRIDRLLQRAVADLEGHLEDEGNVLQPDSGASVTNRTGIPRSPATPNLPINLGLATVAGLLYAFAAVVARETLSDPRMAAEADLEELGLLSLGRVPRAWPLPSPADPIGRRDLDPIADAYRSIATSLHYLARLRSLSTIQVTSHNSASGVTTTTAQLAATLSDMGHDVLVIDANFAHGTLGEQFDVGAGAKGLTDVLAGDVTITDRRFQRPGRSLTVVPAGSHHRSHAIDQRALRSLLADARKRFDIVLLDGPATQLSSDALILGQECDATVFVARSGRTTRRETEASLDLLDQSGTVVLGAILNRARAQPAQRQRRFRFAAYNDDHAAPGYRGDDLTASSR